MTLIERRNGRYILGYFTESDRFGAIYITVVEVRPDTVCESSFREYVIYGDILDLFSEITHRERVRKRHVYSLQVALARKQQFELRNVSQPSQQQLSPC